MFLPPSSGPLSTCGRGSPALKGKLLSEDFRSTMADLASSSGLSFFQEEMKTQKAAGSSCCSGEKTPPPTKDSSWRREAGLPNQTVLVVNPSRGPTEA